MRANGAIMTHSVAEKLAKCAVFERDILELQSAFEAITLILPLALTLTLNSLWEAVPELKSPFTAAGLLKNDTTGISATAIFGFVAMCTEDMAAADPEKRASTRGVFVHTNEC